MAFDKEKIIKALGDKKANLPCHRCGKKKFQIIEGFARISLHNDTDAQQETGQGIPSVMVGCDNCGAITHHAAYALLPKES